MAVSKPSFAIVVPTVYGSMIVSRYDINQTNALLKTQRSILRKSLCWRKSWPSSAPAAMSWKSGPILARMRLGSPLLPQFDYFKELNFGSVEFDDEQGEALTQQRRHDPTKTEHAPLRTIDSYEFINVGLLKIDVEGMEMRVLERARETIARCQLVLYVEFLKSDRAALSQRITDWDYVLHVVQLNFLRIPRELTELIRLEVR